MIGELGAAFRGITAARSAVLRQQLSAGRAWATARGSSEDMDSPRLRGRLLQRPAWTNIQACASRPRSATSLSGSGLDSGEVVVARPGAPADEADSVGSAPPGRAARSRLPHRTTCHSCPSLGRFRTRRRADRRCTRRVATIQRDPPKVDEPDSDGPHRDPGDPPPGLENAKMLVLVNRETGGRIDGVGTPLRDVEEAIG